MDMAPPKPVRDHLPPLVTHLLCPEAYPHRPDKVEFQQTHISYVFLAGDYVYKLKKPAVFSFLDYSTLAQRAHFCQEEVRLNRRLAPEVYLGVMPIIDQRGHFVVAENTDITGRWIIHEYAVKMRRLAEDRMLDQQLKTRQVETAQIRAIARKLAAFHRTAATGEAAQYGSPSCIEQAIADNFQETAACVGQTIGQQMFDTLRNYQQQFLAEHHALLLRRVREGRVCEGHGDLRAEHICLDAEPAQRQLFLDLAEQAQVRLLFVECQADEDEIARRLKARTHSQEISETTSDATWDVHVQQRAQATPFSDLPDHVHLVVATDTALDHGLAKIEAFVQR